MKCRLQGTNLEFRDGANELQNSPIKTDVSQWVEAPGLQKTIQEFQEKLVCFWEVVIETGEFQSSILNEARDFSEQV